MTATYKVTVVQSKDLSPITVMCPCGSAVTVALSNGPLPDQCPSCQKPVDSAAKAALAAAQRFYREAKESKFTFEFAIRDAING
jgi:hypothetical protein